MSMLDDELDELKRLPALVDAVELQVLLLRDEMQSGFSRVDQRFARVDERFAQVDEHFGQVDRRFDEVYGRIESGEATMRDFVLELHSQVMAEIQHTREDVKNVHSQSLALFEELISRIKTLGEGRSSS